MTCRDCRGTLWCSLVLGSLVLSRAGYEREWSSTPPALLSLKSIDEYRAIEAKAAAARWTDPVRRWEYLGAKAEALGIDVESALKRWGETGRQVPGRLAIRRRVVQSRPRNQPIDPDDLYTLYRRLLEDAERLGVGSAPAFGEKPRVELVRELAAARTIVEPPSDDSEPPTD